MMNKKYYDKYNSRTVTDIQGYLKQIKIVKYQNGDSSFNFRTLKMKKLMNK